MSEQDPDFLTSKYLVDPYSNWIRDEGAPVIQGDAIDLLAADVAPWARFGMKGAVCHVDGRCDFLTAFLFELAPGASSAPVRRTYEEAFYVLAGAGETEIVLSDGARHCVEWREGELFAVPVNAELRHRNPGAAAARFVSLNDFRYLMGLYRNEAFLFANDAPLRARQDRAMAAGLRAEPRRAPVREDELTPLPLADMSVGVDLTALASGSSTLARRQMQGRHLLGVAGEGFTLSFASETSEITRMDWRHGVLAGCAPMRFHQHFAAGGGPARFIGVELGSQSSPMFRSRRAVYGDRDVYASGAAIVPREAERADVRAIAEEARRRSSA